MKQCKHENAEHMMPGDSSTPDWCVQVYAEFEQLRCLDCREWLSLGPANETLGRGEMRLAEFLQELHLLWEPGAERERRVAAATDYYAVAYADHVWGAGDDIIAEALESP